MLNEQLPEECVEKSELKTDPTKEEVLEVLKRVRSLIIKQNSFALHLSGPSVIPSIMLYPDFYKDLGILKAKYDEIDYFSGCGYILIDADLFIETTKKYGVYNNLLQRSLTTQEELDLLRRLMTAVKHARNDGLKTTDFEWPTKYDFLLNEYSVYHQYTPQFE